MLVQSEVIFIPGDSPDPQSLVSGLLGKSSKKTHSQVMLDTNVIVSLWHGIKVSGSHEAGSNLSFALG